MSPASPEGLRLADGLADALDETGTEELEPAPRTAIWQYPIKV